MAFNFEKRWCLQPGEPDDDGEDVDAKEDVADCCCDDADEEETWKFKMRDEYTCIVFIRGGGTKIFAIYTCAHFATEPSVCSCCTEKNSCCVCYILNFASPAWLLLKWETPIHALHTSIDHVWIWLFSFQRSEEQRSLSMYILNRSDSRNWVGAHSVVFQTRWSEEIKKSCSWVSQSQLIHWCALHFFTPWLYRLFLLLQRGGKGVIIEDVFELN